MGQVHYANESWDFYSLVLSARNIMTNEEFDVLTRCSANAARELMRRGIPQDRAIEIASDMAVKAVKMKRQNGLGQVSVEPIDAFAEQSQAAANLAPIKALREAISPWLWVTSLIGFGMGLLNARRIATMYRGWKSKNQKKGARA